MPDRCTCVVLVIFQDNLREDLDSKSLDIDIDKLSISDKSESTETDNLSQVSVAVRYS